MRTELLGAGGLAGLFISSAMAAGEVAQQQVDSHTLIPVGVLCAAVSLAAIFTWRIANERAKVLGEIARLRRQSKANRRLIRRLGQLAGEEIALNEDEEADDEADEVEEEKVSRRRTGRGMRDQ
jgi:hypothetical protein